MTDETENVVLGQSCAEGEYLAPNPGGSNAIPGASAKKFIGDISEKVVWLCDIFRCQNDQNRQT